MQKIGNYTVAQIIKKYEKIIETDIENFILDYFTEQGRKDIDEIVNAKIMMKGKNIKSERARIEVITEIIEEEPEINNNEKWKLYIIATLYKNLKNKMNSKELKSLEDLILGDKKYAVLEFNIGENIYDYEVVTKEKQKKLSSIRDNRTKYLIDCSFETTSKEDKEDIIDTKFSKGMFSAIMNKVLNKFFLEEKKMTIKEFKEMLQNSDVDGVEEKYADEFEKYAQNYLKNNLQYMDITKLLLNSAARIMFGIKIKKGEKFKGISLKDTNIGSIKASIEYLRELSKELEKKAYENVSYNIVLKDGSKAIEVNKEILKQFLERCTKEDYITDKEIEDIHKGILNGYLPDDLEKLKIANVGIQDLIDANESYNKETDEEKKLKILEGNIEIIEYLKHTEKLTDEDILELYVQGKLNLDLIKNIDMDKLPKEYYNKKFKLLYDAMVYSVEWANEPDKSINDQTEEVKRLGRYSALYKHLLEEKVNVDELIEILISATGEEYGLDIMDDLYNLNLVTLEKCIDWIGPEILYKQCEEGKIPPTKVRELYKNGTIDLDTIVNIVKKTDNVAQRFMLIGSIFPENTENDKNNREYLLNECISIDSNTRETGEGKERIKIEGEKQSYLKHITDPFDRMSLISLIDDTYYFEMTLDGHAIIHFPDLKKVIIEKMLDKNSKPSYGNATYILDEEYYNRNKCRIVENNKIHRQEMSKNVNLPEVTRIIHVANSWGNEIKKYFGIEECSKWSKEDLAKIDEAIEKIKENQQTIGVN